MRRCLVVVVLALLVAGCKDDFSSLKWLFKSPVSSNLTIAQKAALTRLQFESKKSLRLHINGSLGEPVWMKLKYAVSLSDPAGATRQFLDTFGQIYRINELGKLTALGAAVETDSTFIVSYGQEIGSIPVFSGGLQFVISKKGWISEIRGLVFPNLSISNRVVLSLEDARQKLAGFINESEIDSIPGELAILDSRLFAFGAAKTVKAWHFAYPSDDAGMLQHWFIDAETGQLIQNIISSPIVAPANTNILRVGDDWTAPQYHINHETGAPDYVSWHHVGGYRIGKETEPPQAAVMGFLARHPTLFADANPSRHQRVIEARKIKDAGFTIVRTRQYYGDLPVFGAGLRYVVAPGNWLWSIHGNYLPRLKIDTDIPPALSAAAARERIARRMATLKCPSCNESELKPIVETVRSEVGVAELGILPKTLFSAPPRSSSGRPQLMVAPDPHSLVVVAPDLADLAYKVETISRVYFLDARSGEILYSYSLIAADGGHGDVKIYDANGAQKERYSGFTGINVDQANPSNSTDPDVIAANDAAHATLNYWYKRVDLFPYVFLDEIMDNGGDAVHLVVDADRVDGSGASQCPNAWHVPGSFLGGPDHMVFCRNMVADDIVAHEMTHGVTQHSSGLIYADESGALNESYSDIFGELVFPDPVGTWQHGTSRNMANPVVDHISNYLYPSAACVGNYDSGNCDQGGVHSNCGIPSLAAVYTADGVPNLPPATGVVPGIGRDKLAAMSFATLTNILEEWSGFSDAMLGTVSVCNLWREWGWADKFDVPLSQQDCDVIVNAWSRVGISPTTSMGWYHSSGFFGASEGYVIDDGVYSPGMGCKVQGYILKMTNLDDPGMRVACSDASICPPGGVVSDRLSYSNGEFWAKVESWSEGSDRRQAKIHVGRSNFEDIAVNLEFVPRVPPGLTPQHCDGGWVIQRKSHPVKKHWSNFCLGGKDDEWVGPETAMPGGCVVLGVTLEKLAKDHSRMGSTGHEVGDNNSGARIVSDPVGTSGRRVKVHWWFNPFNIIRYRVIYTVACPPGVDCWPE